MDPIERQAQDRVRRYCAQRCLSEAFAQRALAELWPLARWIAGQRDATDACPVIGINGAQGTGKSTLAGLLQDFLDLLGLRTALLSLDDLYLTRAARLQLAERVHPLLATRGVPGTHDVDLGVTLLERLRSLRRGAALDLPRFDKARDDRAEPSAWRRVEGPIDLVLFEGWCVGTPPQDAAALVRPVNALEAGEDADARWRYWVNERLANEYRRLFAPIARLIFLRAPDFACVFAWRRQQEEDNGRIAGVADSPLRDAAALQRFIAHYERLTRHALDVLPQRADVVIDLDADHRIAAVRYRAGD
ncbi:hypothetical protein AAG565_13155 [Fontimonas sp. SYSU GA230001]|uniref:hypothetical protein n=1 Tax=Fontimonas sp. SYSU GA230001 TaxID=3142450 RepID=UPI0032B476C5